MATFSESLRARDDARLVALLTGRPDLASPSPATLLSLAARSMSRASVQRAMAGLDTAHLECLECLVVLDQAGTAASTDAIVAAIAGVPAPEDEARRIVEVLDRLDTLALVWTPEVGVYRPAPGVDELLPQFPAGLGPRTTESTNAPEADPAVLADAPAGARSILAALTWGPPVGRIPADPSAASAEATRWLLAHHLVRKADAQHILLPRDLALALRDGRTHRGLTPPPPAPERVVPAETVEAESARAAVEITRSVAELLALWQVTPAATLKSGGLGVRDLRRLALHLDTTESRAAFLVELALVSGLVTDDGDEPAAYAPTLDADDWSAADLPVRWMHLVAAWWTSVRTPWLVGSRDERGALRSALDAELHRPWVPRLRHDVLQVLAGTPGHPHDAGSVARVLRWRTPRAVPPDDAVAALLQEAALLGLTGADALSRVGTLLAAVPAQTTPDATVRDALADAMSDALPAAVDELLLQGDLTGIVPGRPTPALEALLADCAEIESTGAAITVRFTPESVTRALDAGRTGEEFLAELARHARRIPQPLDYLVRDAARRHGQIRLGAASSYVRVEDPVLLAGLVDDPALRPLGLFRIAPTVLASAVPARQVLAALRDKGVAPAMEGPDGQIVHADRRTPRVRLAARRPRRGRGTTTDGSAPPRDRTERLESLVAQLRRGDRVDATGPAGSAEDAAVSGGTSEPLVVLGLLREAAADTREVWLDVVGPSGVVTRRRVRPVRVDGGRLRAVDVARESELSVAVHHIVTVEPITT